MPAGRPLNKYEKLDKELLILRRLIMVLMNKYKIPEISIDENDLDLEFLEEYNLVMYKKGSKIVLRLPYGDCDKVPIKLVDTRIMSTGEETKMIVLNVDSLNPESEYTICVTKLRKGDKIFLCRLFIKVVRLRELKQWIMCFETVKLGNKLISNFPINWEVDKVDYI